MTTTTRVRSTCPAHPNYVAGCFGCITARRSYRQSRRTDTQPATTEWAIWLTDQSASHILIALDEATARRRTHWWNSYRPDVAATLCHRKPGTTEWTQVTH